MADSKVKMFNKRWIICGNVLTGAKMEFSKNIGIYMLRHSTFKSFAIISLLALALSSCKEDTIEPEVFGSISGTVISADNSTVIEGALVTTSPPSGAVLTDKSGKFTITNIPVGSYSISVKKTGFKSGLVNVAVKENIETSAIILIEKTAIVAPGLPSRPSPQNAASEQPVNVLLSWSAVDPDNDGSLQFDLFLYEAGAQVQQIAKDYRDTAIYVPNLKYNSIYYWQVVAKDTGKLATNGSIWSFKTRALPNNPIVFASQRDGNYEIYSTDLTEGNTIRLTFNSCRDWWPRLSPNHEKIAFISDESVGPQIYIMNRDGSGRTRVTKTPVTGYHNYGIGFCWSPDGSQFLYSNYNKLYRIDATGLNLTLIATAPANRNFREVEWSPKGDKIVVLTVGINIYDSEIYTMNSDGTNMTLQVKNLPGMLGSPSFSIDGKSLVFTYDVSGFENSDGRQLDSHIFTKLLTDSTMVDYSIHKALGTNDMSPRFSPDGSKIIFTNLLNDGSEQGSIFVMDLDPRSATELNGNNRKKAVVNGEMPDWQ